MAIAALLGEPRAAGRWDGPCMPYLMRQRSPWQRVINVQGRITNSSHSGARRYNAFCWSNEGIRFSTDGRVDMPVYRWEGPTVAQS